MITLYSTGCPRCKILKEKLDQKNIEYIVESDKRKIVNMGFYSVPILQIDEKYYDFGEAIKWVNSQ